ncbi:MAG: hypothetical protein CLLPBCKN_000329 [Chroococcidiopsis cubana SAG 39.79]|jgi:hypothetical protein|uniref:Uncharacterized protein n=1 Tax=Chroococcidiopsis thermalis (strain PCC 7203) TaxID=251229 RepID=K9U3A4_CHRTP|nr:hypothetical protein Chro_3853 [Chroococcidiopsis thermalis PCC 7203]MDZ4870941.1 hypothetical protein [Chroococcidiopsis cubana SAG 39.79]
MEARNLFPTYVFLELMNLELLAGERECAFSKN